MSLKVWGKEVPVEDVSTEKFYWIAKIWGETCALYSRWKNGKTAWSSKPGIAVHFKGSLALLDEVRKQNATEREGVRWILIEVPADASKRWKSRK